VTCCCGGRAGTRRALAATLAVILGTGIVAGLTGCAKEVAMRDSMTAERTVCAPVGDSSGPLSLPESVCECVAHLQARGWEPVPELGTAPLQSCIHQP
jgi:hypothetical protein